ncbi:MAG: LysM peptidoglycan-binding domain-containing protein [Pseudomonadota bacterium]
MKKDWHTLIFSMIWLMILGGIFGSAGKCLATELFPLYSCIKPNVVFWEKVYAQYATTDGVLHDSDNVDIIYGVIGLEGPETRNAYKINRNRIQDAKKKYAEILGTLAFNPSASGPEEKRVEALFGTRANQTAFREAMGNIRCQVGQKDRFRMGIIRSGANLDEIKRIFTSYGLPVDLAYLPHVESSFDKGAYSKFGAAGIWQFTRATGKRFMAIDYALDERWDLIRSSHAAAQLLKENYEKLRDWPIAITAYNHGTAGMLRAKTSKGSYEVIFKGYEGRLFGFASKNFYSEFLAARNVAKNYERYFGELQLHRPAKYAEVVLEGYASIKDVAHNFKLDTAIIRDLNPALREPVYEGQKYIPKGYTLRLPLDAAMDSLKSAKGLLQALYKPHQKPSLFYQVQKGDTAGEIARLHRIKLSDLILANNLNSRAVIYAGQNLRLPAPDEKRDRMAVTSSDQMEKERRLIAFVDSPSDIQSQSKSGSDTEPKPFSKTVETKKETDEIPVNPAIVTGDLLVKQVVTLKGKRIGIIRVQVEETLGHYAEWLRISTEEIKKLNDLRPGKFIRINDHVKIPLDQSSKESFEEKRFEYHKEIVEDFFVSYKIRGVETYQIQEGDNIWTLCSKKFELPLWLIYKYNPGLELDQLKPSQKILIPLVEE